MKIIWKGKVFGPTGIATAGREYVKALVKRGHQVQCEDIWHDLYEFNNGLEFLNQPINAKEAITIFFDYPMYMNDGYGTLFGGFVHEGTRLHDGWSDHLNKVDIVWCPSNAVRRMFKWNGVERTIYVIPHGYNPEIYKPIEHEDEEIFTFLSVNSWTGIEGDRKGTDLLIKAFDEEFKPEEKVRLLLKFGTFFMKPYNTKQRINELLGHENPNILVNQDYVEEKELVTYYQHADCFVVPTRGEGFGITILNSLACGCPVIVTKDANSGHMDFCKGNKGVLWIDAPTVSPGDPKYYHPKNMLANPDLNSLKKQMRWAFEHRKELKEMGKEGYEFVKDWTWDRAGLIMENMITEVLNEQKKG